MSLAAGIPLAALKIAILLTGCARCQVRYLASAEGLTAITFDRAVSTTERARVRELFEMVGQVIEIPERSFDAFTATYSSSHGYHALATLASAAQRAGLDRKTALTAAAMRWQTAFITGEKVL